MIFSQRTPTVLRNRSSFDGSTLSGWIPALEIILKTGVLFLINCISHFVRLAFQILDKEKWKFLTFMHLKYKIKNKSSSLQRPVSILKNSADVCLIPLTAQLNNIVNDCHWPIELGSANITPAHKKESTTDKENYRPISVLPPVSKVFEKLLCDELLDYIMDKFSPLLCGFRKQFSTHHALVRLIERWKRCLDKSGVIVGVLMDLSKAYDCIPHDLLIAKLHAYGLAIKLLHSYLTNRKQRTKISNSFSEWVEILIGIPQRSVLGPLLFNIFINDLLLGIEDGNLCNFAADNTLYTCCGSLNEATFLIESQCSQILDWFKDNFMKMNPEKCQVNILGQKAVPENFSVEIDNSLRKPVPEVTLLGVTLDNKLNFNSHTLNICKEASHGAVRFGPHLEST